MSRFEVPELMTPGEVAAMFAVNTKTVMRWARTGQLSSMRTLGGHHRFFADEVHQLFAQQQANPSTE